MTRYAVASLGVLVLSVLCVGCLPTASSEGYEDLNERIDDELKNVGLGAGEILLTSWDQDGTRQGYDLELISAMATAIRVPIIASGGANGARHMAQALEAGASAVLAASIFHEKSTTIPKVKAELIGQGLEVRPC